jgi:hypothetical protein
MLYRKKIGNPCPKTFRPKRRAGTCCPPDLGRGEQKIPAACRDGGVVLPEEVEEHVPEDERSTLRIDLGRIKLS